MTRTNLFFILFSIFLINLQAQNTVTISGKAVDEVVEMPVEAATVYLSLKKDSTVVEYSITDANGDFKLEIKKINEPVFFRITDELNGDYFTEFESVRNPSGNS